MIRKDYKRSPNKIPPAEGSSGIVRGFLSGLSVGLTIAASVHVYHVIVASDEASPMPTPPQLTAQTSAEIESPQPEPRISDREVNDTLLYGSNVLLPDWKMEYILQAKSYRTQAEAQSLKQRILSLGYKSIIRKIEEEGEAWYRVELGPYHELKDISETRMRLKNHRIEIIVKQQKSE